MGLIEHNGCIIADSVGLGKTFEALAIIKYFELFNYKVLVLCSKKLRSKKPPRPDLPKREELEKISDRLLMRLCINCMS